MIVGISGLIGSGKNTVAEHLTDNYGFRKDSFAASLKDACSVIFGWDRTLLEGETKESREWREQVDPWWSEKLGIENFSPRLALQLVGTDALRNHFNEGMWFLTVENRIRKNPDQHVVISDVRFPNEVDFIRKQGGVLIKVSRGQEPVWYETARLANSGNKIAQEVMLQTYPTAHFSEWAWIGQKYDYTIINDGSVTDLQSQVAKILENMN